MKSFILPNNKILQIEQDQDSCDPRKDFDNLGTMVCFHKKYDLGDKHDLKSGDYSGWVDAMKSNTKKGDIILPIYMYDHSGISISTKPFNCPWDSGQVGFIKVSLETIRKEYGRATKENIERATNVLLSEVETYEQYLRGDVYQFTIKNEKGEVEDSCGGFFGYCIKDNGILDHLSNEDKEAVLQCA